MAVTAAIIKELFEQKFSTAPDADINFAIQRAELRCSLLAWEDRRDVGIILFVAHLLECERQQIIITSGASTALSEGQAGNLGTSSGEFLDRTVHGQEFARMEGTHGLPTVTGFVV